MYDNWDMPNYSDQEPVYIDEMKTVRELTAQLLAAETRIRVLEEALEYYRDGDNYQQRWEEEEVVKEDYASFKDDDGEVLYFPPNRIQRLSQSVIGKEKGTVAHKALSQPAPAPSLYADVLRAAVAFSEGRQDDTGYGRQLKNAEKLTSAVEALPQAERAVWSNIGETLSDSN